MGSQKKLTTVEVHPRLRIRNGQPTEPRRHHRKPSKMVESVQKLPTCLQLSYQSRLAQTSSPNKSKKILQQLMESQSRIESQATDLWSKTSIWRSERSIKFNRGKLISCFAWAEDIKTPSCKSSKYFISTQVFPCKSREETIHLHQKNNVFRHYLGSSRWRSSLS